MTSALENIAAPPQSREDECTEAVEELIASFGLKCFVACLANTALADAPSALHQHATLRAIQGVLRGIVHSTNPQLEAEIMALGAGLFLSDDATMTRLGAKHGITRAAISKRVLDFCDRNGLPPSSYMRGAKDRLTYAKTNRHEKLPRAI